MSEPTKPAPAPTLAASAGSAQCEWCISPLGWPHRECGAPASHADPQTGRHFCLSHAEDYAEFFGWESLRSIGAESPNSVMSEGRSNGAITPGAAKVPCN